MYSADPQNRETCTSIDLPDGRFAICNRDPFIGGIKVGDAGFFFEPFGECILTDSPVALRERV